ncbi:MAG: hypothetical protein U0R50_13245 [Gaiellales bacterium]
MTDAVGLFRRGPAWNQRETVRAHRLMAEHRAYVMSLVDAGALESAGPVQPLDEQLRGEFVGLVVGGDEDALRAALEHDPAVVDGVLVVDVLPWYR